MGMVVVRLRGLKDNMWTGGPSPKLSFTNPHQKCTRRVRQAMLPVASLPPFVPVSSSFAAVSKRKAHSSHDTSTRRYRETSRTWWIAISEKSCSSWPPPPWSPPAAWPLSTFSPDVGSPPMSWLSELKLSCLAAALFMRLRIVNGLARRSTGMETRARRRRAVWWCVVLFAKTKTKTKKWVEKRGAAVDDIKHDGGDGTD